MKNYANTVSLNKEFKVREGKSNLKISFLGDLMPMYKFEWRLSDDIRSLITNSDYLVCNFEGLLSDLEKGKSVLLSQNHNSNILNSLKEILPPEKIILSVANNHSADYGRDYFFKNIEALRSEGFIVIGARDNASYLTPEGINIVAATQWSNQHHGYLSFLENIDGFYSEGMFNLIYPHWGHELEFYPRVEQVDMAKELLEKWDSIVGHHTHIPGPISSYRIGGEDKVVAYSLGDSATGLFRRRYRHGIALTFDFECSNDNKPKLLSGKWSYTHLQKKNTTYVLESVERTIGLV
jgi:poly-gamma-glutamate capsule biosynthesis protein CapA/YwtB (metallophosphatase superfamily)